MTLRAPEPNLYDCIEHEWAEELAAYFNRAKEEVFQQVRTWLVFPSASTPELQ